MPTPAAGPNPCLVTVPPFMTLNISCQSVSMGPLLFLQRVTITGKATTLAGPVVVFAEFQGKGNGPMQIILPNPLPPPSTLYDYVILPGIQTYELEVLFQYGQNNNWTNAGQVQITNSEGPPVTETIVSSNGGGEAILMINMALTPPPPYLYNTEPPEEVAQLIPVCQGDQLPGYPTKVIYPIPGNPLYVVQLWKGFCPNIPALLNVVGGAGAEVGLYLKASPEDTCWMPDYQQPQPISFSLTYPGPNGDVTFFSADTQTCWWRHKWMQPQSFKEFCLLNPGAPTDPAGYTLNYQVGTICSGSW